MSVIRLLRKMIPLALLLTVAAAASSSPGVAVTVYNSNLGLVRDARVIGLVAGESVFSFTDVAAQIDPTSVHFRAVDGLGFLEVLEQNYEYDLVSSDKLFEKYLEKRVEIFFKESADVLRGRLLSHGRGSMVIEEPEAGKITVVEISSIRNVELLGNAEGFVTRPTLVWTLMNETAGSREIEVEYLTGGINWHAEYVALADEKNETIDFAGWVSVDNRSGADYKDARLKLMAGDVGRVAQDLYMAPMGARLSYGAKAEARVEERAIFEYHIYEVKRPTTIRNNQVKQIGFVPNSTVPVVKEYLYEPARDPKKIGVYLEFINDEKSGLGIPIPAGVVRIFQDDGRGGSEFIGEDRIGHTPKNEDVRLRVGYAFDIVGERKVLNESRISDRVKERTVEITLRNRKENPVRVKIRERIEGDWSVEQESFPHERKDVRTAEWTVPVGPDEEVVHQYMVRIRY